MKKSGIFWTLLIITVLYYLFNVGIATFFISLLVYHIIAIIVQFNDDISIFNDGNDDTLSFRNMKELFLNKPYLYLMVHLFLIGFVIAFYHIVINIGEYLSTINDRIDNYKIISKKEKKKSFNEYIHDK